MADRRTTLDKSPLNPGDSFGYYRVVKPLGSGGMGLVYEVEHATLKKRYALKMLSPDLLEDDTNKERFMQEARVMAGLEHPNLVRVEDFGDHKGNFWLRMELIQGVNTYKGRAISLEEIMEKSGGRLRESAVHEYARDILNGLAYAHGKGAIHRDLKPSNILLQPEGAKISDFGLVRLAKEEWFQTRVRLTVSQTRRTRSSTGGSRSTDSSSASYLGTYEYMSPEQKEGKEADHRSDLYSVGLIIYRMLTGRRSLSLKPPSAIVPSLNPDWDRWCVHALETDPENRFQSAEELLEFLPDPTAKVERPASTQVPVAVKSRRRKSPVVLMTRGTLAACGILALCLVGMKWESFFPNGTHALGAAGVGEPLVETAALSDQQKSLLHLMGKLSSLETRLSSMPANFIEAENYTATIDKLRNLLTAIRNAPEDFDITADRLGVLLAQMNVIESGLIAAAHNAQAVSGAQLAGVNPAAGAEAHPLAKGWFRGKIINPETGPTGYTLHLPEGYTATRFEDWSRDNESSSSKTFSQWHESTMPKCVYSESYIISNGTHVIHFSVVNWPGPDLEGMSKSTSGRLLARALRIGNDAMKAGFDKDGRLMRRAQLPTSEPRDIGIEFLAVGKGNMFYIMRSVSDPVTFDQLLGSFRDLYEGFEEKVDIQIVDSSGAEEAGGIETAAL